MTIPSLTSDGFMYWPPRDWAESLCTPLPDGTWLVQAPLAGTEKPLLYILRDTATKDQFLFLAVGLIRLRTAFRAAAPLWPLTAVRDHPVRKTGPVHAPPRHAPRRVHTSPVAESHLLVAW